MIVLYAGRRGAGKTLTMVKDAYNFFKQGWLIISNMDYLGFDYKKIAPESVLGMVDDEEMRDCVLVLDELQTIIDSRRSMKGFNVRFAYFIQQIRKRNVVILATTQFVGRVDLAFREHVDVIVYPKLWRATNGAVVVDAEYLDATSFGMIRQSVVFVGDTIFPLYDTRGLVRAVNK